MIRIHFRRFCRDDTVFLVSCVSVMVLFLCSGGFLCGFLPPLGFHVPDRQVRVPVPSPAFRALEYIELDCFHRTEVKAGTAELAVMLPGRLTVCHDDVSDRADLYAGTARRAGILDRERCIPVMHIPGKRGVEQEPHQR